MADINFVFATTTTDEAGRANGSDEVSRLRDFGVERRRRPSPSEVPHTRTESRRTTWPAEVFSDEQSINMSEKRRLRRTNGKDELNLGDAYD